jgi:hypothetical protein
MTDLVSFLIMRTVIASNPKIKRRAGAIELSVLTSPFGKVGKTAW